ncbi:MAG: NYN domain-containing protein [Sinimarinibacterium flocculans]|uniref:NYN domain-containing protein n=1 Tax=Sinimarinibacterium flocculans TaxID=985250 RepID=UPI003C6AA1CE
MADKFKLAVLIDGDNVNQPAIAKPLLDEVTTYGVASVKRIYGDWTKTNLSGWKKVLAEHALQPVQQFAYTTGKNATDGAMIIDAMDLLYTRRFDGFCIVSSDSDFTGLAKRLRQDGLTVYGFGERKTPESLRAACDKFIYLDVLRGAKAAQDTDAGAPPAQKTRRKRAKTAPQAALGESDAESEARVEAKPEPKSDPRRDAELLSLLREAVDDAADDDGWAHLSAVGSLIAKRKADFDSRNYGFKKLGELVIATALFEIDERKSADGKQKTLYLRDKRRKN